MELSWHDQQRLFPTGNRNRVVTSLFLKGWESEITYWRNNLQNYTQSTTEVVQERVPSDINLQEDEGNLFGDWNETMEPQSANGIKNEREGECFREKQVTVQREMGNSDVSYVKEIFQQMNPEEVLIIGNSKILDIHLVRNGLFVLKSDRHLYWFRTNKKVSQWHGYLRHNSQ